MKVENMKTTATELAEARTENKRMKTALNKIVRYCHSNNANWTRAHNQGGATSLHAILNAVDLIGHHAEAALSPAPKVQPMVRVSCAGEIYEGNIINSAPIADRPDCVEIRVYDPAFNDAKMLVTGTIVEGD